MLELNIAFLDAVSDKFLHSVPTAKMPMEDIREVAYESVHSNFVKCGGRNALSIKA